MLLIAPLPSRAEARRRLPRLLFGLVIIGVGIAVMVRSGLGLGPWDVLHQGLSRLTGIPIGMVGIIVGLLILVAWLPLREQMGLGTLLNTIVIGVVIDLTMLVIPDLEGVALPWLGLTMGVVTMAIGSGFYIGAGLGPGPRDGLMTGIARRGPSVRLVRTVIEVSALTLGWLLGGTVGVGTVIFALTIGPLVQLALARLSLPPLLPATVEPPTRPPR